MLAFHFSCIQYSATFDDFEAGNYMLVQNWNLPRSVNISITCGLKPGRPLQFAPLPGKSEACDWHYNSPLGILTYIGKRVIQRGNSP